MRHTCKDGSVPSPAPWKIVRRDTPFHDWIMAADSGVVCTGFGKADEALLVNARHAHDEAARYRDALNLVRRRLLDLAVGRNAAEMKREAEAIANLIRTRLDRAEGEHE